MVDRTCYPRGVSKAFTKDEAWEEPIIPPRAPVPAGIPNYVTPRGLRLLRAELAGLEAERHRLDADRSDEAEYRRRLAILTGRTSELAARLASAALVDPRRQPRDLVRFGASVTLRTVSGERAGEERRLEIVGIDEADAAHGRVAFTAPIARAILGRAVGDTAALDTPRGRDLLEVVSIDYAAARVAVACVRSRDLALAVLVAVIWGFGFIATRIGLDSFSPPQLTALRFLIAGVPAAFVPRPPIAWSVLAAIGLTLFAGQFLFQFFGIASGMPPGLASVIVQTQAFFTVLFAAVALGERPARRQVIGMAAALVGCAADRPDGRAEPDGAGPVSRTRVRGELGRSATCS